LQFQQSCGFCSGTIGALDAGMMTGLTEITGNIRKTSALLARPRSRWANNKRLETLLNL